MSDPDVTTIIIPTQMEREDKFIVLAVMFGTPLLGWEAWLHGVPIWLMIPPVLLVAIWVLTSESVVDVELVGPIAGGIRSKLGLRRAHEWLLAYAHYFKVAEWPRQETRWQNSRSRSAIRTWTPWLKWPSGNGVTRLSKRLHFWSRC